MHQVELSRTRIKAPFDGILDQLPLKAGAFIAPGQPCGTLIDKDPLLVVAHVAESQITKIRNGAPASAILATGENVTGFVRYIAESPSLATRTFQIEVEVENKNFLLRDGVSADLEIESERVRASQIPRSALTLDDTDALACAFWKARLSLFAKWRFCRIRAIILPSPDWAKPKWLSFMVAILHAPASG